MPDWPYFAFWCVWLGLAMIAWAHIVRRLNRIIELLETMLVIQGTSV